MGIRPCAQQEAHINPAVKLQDVVHLDTEMEFQVMTDPDDEAGVVLLSLRRIQYEKYVFVEEIIMLLWLSYVGGGSGVIR